jgi:hypothetical protein
MSEQTVSNCRCRERDDSHEHVAGLILATRFAADIPVSLWNLSTTSSLRIRTHLDPEPYLPDLFE